MLCNNLLRTPLPDKNDVPQLFSANLYDRPSVALEFFRGCLNALPAQPPLPRLPTPPQSPSASPPQPLEPLEQQQQQQPLPLQQQPRGGIRRFFPPQDIGPPPLQQQPQQPPVPGRGNRLPPRGRGGGQYWNLTPGIRRFFLPANPY